MIKPVKLALVGAGAFGTRDIEALQTMPGVELFWICDISDERRRPVGETFHVAHVTDDFREAWPVCQA
jgi:2-hydroxy-4-carboxymuconate semialdehyde hemiacetal dehydrogenase